MTKIQFILSLLFITTLSACSSYTINQIDVSPDLDVAAEIPSDAALSWLLREPPVILDTHVVSQGYSACNIAADGVSFGVGSKTMPFGDWEVYRWDLNLITNSSINVLVGSIMLRKVDSNSTWPKDICYAYFSNYPLESGIDVQSMIDAKRKEQSQMLTALKVVGVQFAAKWNEPAK